MCSRLLVVFVVLRRRASCQVFASCARPSIRVSARPVVNVLFTLHSVPHFSFFVLFLGNYTV